MRALCKGTSLQSNAASAGQISSVYFLSAPHGSALKDGSTYTSCKSIQRRFQIMSELIRFDLDVVDSTQTIAEKSIDQLKEDFWYLWTANQQTAGRGQHGRAWYSPADKSISATYAFTTEQSQHMGCLPLVATYSAIEVMQSFGVNDLKLKWINDLFVKGKKLGGALVNLHSLPPNRAAVIIGIGINVNCSKAELDPIPCDATSMLLETGKEQGKASIIDSLSCRLQSNVEVFLKEGFLPFQSKINSLLEKFDGNAIAIDTGSSVSEGTILEIDQTGALVLSNGCRFISGTILKSSIGRNAS